MDFQQKNAPICFFDSGVGGLSVYSLFKKILPNENTIYFGDTKNLPYGNKSQKELVEFARNILEFFTSQNAKAVVIACNTSSALVYDVIKNDYNFPIFPIIQSCANVISQMDINRVGVFATLGTINSRAYSSELKKYNDNLLIKEIACPNWVNIVETNSINSDFARKDITLKLAEMKTFNPQKIILGCTHYPYLLNSLKQIYGKDVFIDPASIFVDYIKQELNKKALLNDTMQTGREKFYVSASPEIFVKNAKLFYSLKQLPELYDTIIKKSV